MGVLLAWAPSAVLAADNFRSVGGFAIYLGVLPAQVVQGHAAEPGQAVVEKRLEPMPIAGAMSYGNYFPMPAKGPYRIDVHIVQSATGKTVDATFGHALAR